MWTAFVTSEKKQSFWGFFFSLSSSPIPPSLLLLSIKCSLSGASRLRLSLSLFEVMWRREPSPCWYQDVWDALTPVCFLLGSYLYISKGNKQYTADLAYPSIGCKQVGRLGRFLHNYCDVLLEPRRETDHSYFVFKCLFNIFMYSFSLFPSLLFFVDAIVMTFPGFSQI